MTKKQTDSSTAAPSPLRQVKPKHKLGLKVPPPLRLPHEDLIRPLHLPEIPPVDAQETGPPAEVVVNHQLTTKPPMVVNHQLTTKPPMVANHQDALVVNHQANKIRSKDRHRRDRTLIGIRLMPDIINQMKQFCSENKITTTEFIEMVVNHFFEVVVNQTREKVVNHQSGLVVKNPLDDLMIINTYDDIRALYQKYTGNRWKPSDDRVGQTLNGTDRRLIEIGMLQTLLNARGKRIHSFKYFIPEIELAIEARLQNDTLDIMLKRRREQWTEWQARPRRKREGK
jgi:hypothetical protein